MGQQDVVEPLDSPLFELLKEMGNGRQGAGINEKAELVRAVDPGADKTGKAFEPGLDEIDTG
jgi:hypothetical protein